MSETVKLPAQFTDLQALANRFAISDDVARDAATTSASDEDRRLLVDTISTRFDAINAYLDHHDDEPAHLLGRLAETACEVGIEIGLPKST
jgi:hypothetical protein